LRLGSGQGARRVARFPVADVVHYAGILPVPGEARKGPQYEDGHRGLGRADGMSRSRRAPGSMPSMNPPMLIAPPEECVACFLGNGGAVGGLPVCVQRGQKRKRITRSSATSSLNIFECCSFWGTTPVHGSESSGGFNGRRRPTTALFSIVEARRTRKTAGCQSLERWRTGSCDGDLGSSHRVHVSLVQHCLGSGFGRCKGDDGGVLVWHTFSHTGVPIRNSVQGPRTKRRLNGNK